jgi:hypothetical protein
MAARFITQILILLTVATVGTITLHQLGISVIISFLLSVIVQFGLYYAFIICLETVVQLKNKQLENERIKEFSLQGLEVTCPCSLKKTEFVPIVLNTNNSYKCNHCTKHIGVYIVPETALITETIANIELPPIPTGSQQ